MMKGRLEALERRSAALDHEIAALRNSTSWRLTAPMRALASAIRKTSSASADKGAFHGFAREAGAPRRRGQPRSR